MKILIYTIAFFFMFNQPALADEKSEVAGLVKEKIGLVIKLLKDKTIDKKERNEQIIAAVLPILDFELMAQLSLGKTSWQSISEEQQKEFTELFVKRTQESYLEKLDLYSNEEVVYKDATMEKNRIFVMTELVYKGDKIEMLYKFYKSKDGWKGYDVEILGVSIIQTYRSQFNGVMKKGGIEELLKKLKVTGEFEISTEKK
ncbi:MAG: ABC transporter substrate-binding protein [SAR324 cluster bacterium]|nr:ABC transporter substrate-binding protein [SAR324 cluster bacterium]